MNEVVLYDYWRSSASYRVRIALNMLGIDYATVPVDLLDGSHKSPDYLKLNPQGLLPTLVIDGMRLTQSLSIVEYLAEIQPESGLLPREPAAGKECGHSPMRSPWISIQYATCMSLRTS